MDKLFHIAINKNQGAEYAILPGDPGRVPKIAEFLDDARPLAQNREFTSYCGTLCGKRIIIMSTGIGGPSAAIALEELAKAGVKTAIRIGTCGGIHLDVVPGDLVIPTAAVRMEGTSKEYAPIEFPAAADFEVLSALAKAAEENRFRFHTGIIQSKDSFYGQHSPETMPVEYELKICNPLPPSGFVSRYEKVASKPAEAGFQTEPSITAPLADSAPQNNELIKIKMLTGEVIQIKRKNVIGWCHHTLHKGAINRSILEKHDCLGKNFARCKNSSKI